MKLNLKVTNTSDPVVLETFRFYAVLELFDGWMVPVNAARQPEYCISTAMTELRRLITLAYVEQLSLAQSTRLLNVRKKVRLSRLKFKKNVTYHSIYMKYVELTDFCTRRKNCLTSLNSQFQQLYKNPVGWRSSPRNLSSTD